MASYKPTAVTHLGEKWISFQHTNSWVNIPKGLPNHSEKKNLGEKAARLANVAAATAGAWERTVLGAQLMHVASASQSQQRRKCQRIGLSKWRSWKSKSGAEIQAVDKMLEAACWDQSPWVCWDVWGETTGLIPQHCSWAGHDQPFHTARGGYFLLIFFFIFSIWFWSISVCVCLACLFFAVWLLNSGFKL